MSLIIEHHSNGKCTVKFKKDWNPGRIGRAYTPPLRNHMESRDAYKIQSMLLKPTSSR